MYAIRSYYGELFDFSNISFSDILDGLIALSSYNFV